MSLEYKILGQTPLRTVINSNVYLQTSEFASSSYRISSNGTSWTTVAAPSGADFARSAFGNGVFVMIPSSTTGSGTTPSTSYYSTDATNWTSTTIPSMVAENVGGYFHHVVYGGDKFVAVAQNTNKAAYSFDGITWNLANLPVTGEWFRLAYSGSQFVVVGGQDRVIYSSDGITWTSASSPAPAGTTWTAIAHGNGTYLAIGTDSSTFPISYQAIRSTDGINWTLATTPFSSFSPVIAYGEGVWVVASGSGAVIRYSTNNGTSWTNSSGNPSPNARSIVYDGSKFILATDQGTLTSPDGITWTQVDSEGTYVYDTTFASVQSVTPTTHYQVPTGKSALVSSIFIAESADLSATYDLAIVPSGETLATKHYLRKDTPLAGSQFHVVDTKITLAAGDKVITDGTSSNVSVNVFGVEQ
jgi:hypothetical protein